MKQARLCRLAVIASHPIQYFTPIYRRLAATPGIALDVFFCRDFGVATRFDKQFDRDIQWDVDLLSGYRHSFLANISPFRDTFNPLHAINPSVFWHVHRHYEAIWVNGYLYPTNWIASCAARLGGAQVLLRSDLRIRKQERGGIPGALREILLRRAVRRANALLYIGKENREAYERYGATESQLFFSPYSVDTDSIAAAHEFWQSRRPELRRTWGVPIDSTVVLFVGKLTLRKHPEALIDALGLASQSHNLHVLFVGSGPLEGELRARAAHVATDRITFAGFVNQSRITEAYCLADIFAMPSEDEPWGLVLNEAMCSHLPCVVSSDVGAARDLIDHDETGLLFRTGEWREFASCLCRLANDPKLRDRVGSAASRRAAQYSYDNSASGVLDALRALGVYERPSTC